MNTYIISDKDARMYRKLVEYLYERYKEKIHDVKLSNEYRLESQRISKQIVPEKEYEIQENSHRIKFRIRNIKEDERNLEMTLINWEDGINEILREAEQQQYEHEDGKICVSISGSNGQWSHPIQVMGRRLDTMYVSDKVITEVMEDIKKFNENKELYKKLGINYKRTYLFYGMPGTGKTSFIKAIATEFNKTLGIINASYHYTSEILMSVIINFQEDILVVEDFDQICFDSNASFSSVLNFIDGIVNKENKIIILTTNNLEIIGKVVSRPGRIDKIVEFGFVDTTILKKMINVFFSGKYSDAYINDFANELPPKLTTAHLESYLLKYYNDDIKTHVKELFRDALQEGQTKTLQSKFESFNSVYI